MLELTLVLHPVADIVKVIDSCIVEVLARKDRGVHVSWMGIGDGMG